MTKKMIVGRFGSSYGLQGHIKLFSFTQPYSDIISYPNWFVKNNDDWEPIVKPEVIIKSNRLYVKLSGYDTPEQVKQFNQWWVGVTRDQLPKLEVGNYYWTDLEGLVVINKDSIILGKVSHLFATGANDVMVVKDGDKDRLLPFIKMVIQEIDLEKAHIIVDWDPAF